MILGKLDPDNFAGGSIKRDGANAKAALHNVVARPLEMDTTTAAFGVAEVVDENMSNATRVHAVENGEDLADYAMIAFGGAAPLHAGRLSEKLGIDRVLVPPGAGVGSAIGFLRAPFSFEANRSVHMPLSAFDPEVIRNLLAELESEATRFVRTCDADASIEAEFKVYMRYTGQGWEIPILLTAEQAMNPDAETFKRLFEVGYAALFGRAVDGMDVDIIVWVVNATTPAAVIQRITEREGDVHAETSSVRSLFDPALGETVEAKVVQREVVKPGVVAEGPGAITVDETTIILPVSRRAIAQPDGCIDIVKRA